MNSKVLMTMAFALTIFFTSSLSWAADVSSEVNLGNLLAAVETAGEPTEPASDQGNAGDGVFFTHPISKDAEGPAERKRVLPFLQHLARGVELPKPFGVGVSGAWQYNPYSITSVKLSLGTDPLVDASPDGIDADILATALGVKADLWLFPFLNLYVAYGDIDVDTLITLRNIPVAPGTPPPLPPPPVMGDAILDLGFEGNYLSTGGAFAFGYKDFFLTLEGTYIDSDLSPDGNSYDSSKFTTIRTGIRGGFNYYGTAVWLGALEQKSDQRYTGSIGGINFDVTIDTADWSGLIGIQRTMNKTWDVVFEGQFGKRKGAVVTITYRF